MVRRYGRRSSRRSARRPARFPSSTYGRLYAPRGTEFGLTRYGATANLASPDQLANRRADGWVGQGKYQAGRNFRKWATKAVGSAQRFAVKRHLADMALDAGLSLFAPEALPEALAVEGVAGKGAYDVTTNQLINKSGPSHTMHSSSDETNDIVFSRSEFLQDIVSTVSPFQTIYSANLNPGLSSSFPWLSQIACYFEEYEWIQLVYEVRSMVTEGNTSASGTIVHATQYNPGNGLFTSKQKMENYEYAQSHKVTDHGQHGIECDPDKRSGSASEYVRTGPVPFGQDVKTYDLGLYQLAVANSGVSMNLGELWVHYTVKLKKTKIPDPGSIINTSLAQFAASSVQNNSARIGSATWSPFATSTISCTISGGGTGVLTVTLPATMLAAIKYDCTLTYDTACVAGANLPSYFILTAVNATVSGDQPNNVTLAGAGLATTTAQGVSCATNFTPNGVGQVVLTLTNSYAFLPISGSVFLTINPSPIF